MRTLRSGNNTAKPCGGNKRWLYLVIFVLLVLILCGTALIFLPYLTKWYATQTPTTTQTPTITQQPTTTQTPTITQTSSTTQAPSNDTYNTNTTQPITRPIPNTTATPTTESTENPTTSPTPIPTETPIVTYTTNTTQTSTTEDYRTTTGRVEPNTTNTTSTVPYEHVAIVDADSTGTRLTIYRFKASKETSNEPRLLAGDFFYENKTTLSFYLNKPDEGVEFIEDLLAKGDEFIPESSAESMWVALRTSSGLRNEDEDKVDRLMRMLRDFFASSILKRDRTSVKIIEDNDKEIYNWITVNYLKGSLSSSPAMQYAIMNFAKYGIQTTYSKVNAEEATDELETIRKITVGGKDINVAIQLEHRTSFIEAHHAILTNGNNKQGPILYSVCVNPKIFKDYWIYQNLGYFVGGEQNGKDVVDFEACTKLIKESVLPKIEPKPETLKKLAVWNNFFFSGKTNEITVGSIHEQAKKECQILKNDQPFNCLKLIYKWTLLSDGIGLPEDYTLQNPPPISGHNVSWTLGCALNLLNYVKFLN